jgi:hypothetical protein
MPIVVFVLFYSSLRTIDSTFIGIFFQRQLAVPPLLLLEENVKGKYAEEGYLHEKLSKSARGLRSYEQVASPLRTAHCRLASTGTTLKIMRFMQWEETFEEEAISEMLSERSFAWIPSPPIRPLRSCAQGGREEHCSAHHDRRRQRRQQSQDIELVHSTLVPYSTLASSPLARAVAFPVDADVACSASRDGLSRRRMRRLQHGARCGRAWSGAWRAVGFVNALHFLLPVALSLQVLPCRPTFSLARWWLTGHAAGAARGLGPGRSGGAGHRAGAPRRHACGCASLTGSGRSAAPPLGSCV